MELSNRFYNTLQSFGMKDIEFPVFYSAPVGIRFDIGDSADLDPYSDSGSPNPLYVDHCLKRAINIFDSLFTPPDILAIQLYFCDQNVLNEDIDAVLSATGLPPPQETVKREALLDGEPINIALLLWDLSTIDFRAKKLLREVIVADLGGENLLTSSVFWVCSEANVMFYLYDDRGADLVASEKSTIKDIYLKFNKWILEYDREKIELIFSN